MGIFNWLRKKDEYKAEEIQPIKMLKKNKEAFFKSIRKHQNKEVKTFVNSNEEFLKIVREGKPKKDEGQSGLQIAFKVANFEIATFLILKGADVNYMPNVANEWNLPVLHNCIRSVFYTTETLEKDKGKFKTAFQVLELMLKNKSNPNNIDSYGNSSLMRALLDAKIFILHPDFTETLETLRQTRQVFKLLLDYGADLNYSNEKRPKIEEMINNFGLNQYNLI